MNAKPVNALNRVASALLRIQRDLRTQTNELQTAATRVQKALKLQQRRQTSRGGGGELPGYYVGITGTAGRTRQGYRAADAGLIGKRVGRGPVRMTGSRGQSTAALTAAFAKLLSAQSQLQQLRADLESLKARK